MPRLQIQENFFEIPDDDSLVYGALTKLVVTNDTASEIVFIDPIKFSKIT